MGAMWPVWIDEGAGDFEVRFDPHAVLDEAIGHLDGAQWRNGADPYWHVPFRHRSSLRGLAAELHARVTNPARLLWGSEPGEAVLHLELVPQCLWQQDAKAEVVDGLRCGVCGRRGARWYQTWAYDDVTRTRWAVELSGSCEDCYFARHLGHARVCDRDVQAKAWLGRMNAWDELGVQMADMAATKQWAERSMWDDWRTI